MLIKIENYIKEFVQAHQNREGIRTRWEEPLVTYASAGDPLFNKLKEVVSPTHALPQDLLPDAKTVITYFLPFARQIPLSNKKGRMSSSEWAVAYIETNKLITQLNEYIHKKLGDIKYQSVILPPTHNFDTQLLISDWSHKHVGFISGLGKFGLHQMLITEKGCCGRLGSIITNLEIEPTKRAENEYCLYKHNGTCQKCVEKCAQGALSVIGFDRHKCYELLLDNADIYANEGLADVCGKCVSIVPCSFTNPVK